jgi:hypothetical protein
MELSAEARALLHKAADQIEAKPETLDMGVWNYEEDCGTVACIAGHIVIAAGEDFAGYTPYQAAKLLGLSNEDFNSPRGVLDRLFLVNGPTAKENGRHKWRGLSQVPTEQVIATIRHFAETGEVDWSV